MNKDEIIVKMEQILSSMLKGKRVRDLIPVNDISGDEELISFTKSFNKFVGDIVECQDFIDSLVNGNLNTDPPARDNYAAGPLKELHSQLISMSVNIKDLCNGKMVSKLFYPGELFDNYNKLISIVSDMMKDEDQVSGQEAVSSWSYHQVLSAINQLTTMVLQYDDSGKLVFANMTAQKMLSDINQLPMVDKPLESDLLSYLGKFTNIIKRMKAHDVLGSRFPVKTELKDNKTDKWYSVHTDVAKLIDGKIGVIHMIDDISEWKYNEQELRNEASFDPLTSAYTRKVGNKRFQEMINARESSNNCVAFIDMDGLKNINDTYGHTEGDFAIKTVATILMSTVRDTDWVVRYGGDEFLILFKDCEEPAAKRIISRMYEELEDVNNSIDKPYGIQFSTGLTHIDKDMAGMQQIIDIVDEKMYKNKVERKQNQNVL